MATSAFCPSPPAFRAALAAPRGALAPRKRDRALLRASALRRSSFAPTTPLAASTSLDDPVSSPSPRGVPQTDARSTSMRLDKVVVAGGTGFVGSRLVRKLLAGGSAVTVLTRAASSAAHLPSSVIVQPWRPDASTLGGAGLADALRDADLVVNLCGAPVVTRWTPAGKALIMSSRLEPTSTLARAIAALPDAERPRCVVNSSAIGCYGTESTATFDEDGALAKDDFLAEVCSKWEAAAAPIGDLTRLVIVRTGVVMGVGGGALARMLPVFRLGLGGPVGSGTQWVSWIHIDDLVDMFVRAGETPSARGVYNGVAPNAVTMGEVCASLARALKRPNFFPVPDFVLRLVYGEGADVVLKGQRVRPAHWLSEGFTFTHSTIDDAMQAIAKEVSK